ncbi:MAG TPA: hypothetical protein VI488_17610 [Candidatus Angelobacter sp.]
MKRTLLPLFLLVATIGANSQESPQTSPSQPSGTLPAPVQLSPTNGARLHGYPRRIVFEWSKVPGADGYGIELDYYWGQWSSQAGKTTHMERVNDPTFTFDFYGNQPGSWRVWAMDKKDRPGTVSAWSLFSFGPENEVMPLPPPDSPPRFSQMPVAAPLPTQVGKVHEPPLSDPETGEPCNWPPPGLPSGVTPPKVTYHPMPEFTEAARKAKVNGGRDTRSRCWCRWLGEARVHC